MTSELHDDLVLSTNCFERAEPFRERLGGINRYRRGLPGQIGVDLIAEFAACVDPGASEQADQVISCRRGRRGSDIPAVLVRIVRSDIRVLL
ncbi:hypothetical protein D3C81_1903980 [compost metagenome]